MPTSSKTERIPLADVRVTNRRREEFGDIEGLAESIRKYGLFHPIVVDEENNLIAGERRLRACRFLEWSEIPARMYRELTDDEKSEIELEENLRRKDLTPYEQSRNLVKLAETAAKIDEKELSKVTFDNSEGELRFAEKRNSAGRPEKPGSLRRVAERLGVSPAPIVQAQKHVAAVERYPELQSIPTQKDALTIAKNLDALPEETRTEAREKLAQNDADTLTTLAEKPPMPARDPNAKKSAAERWTQGIYETQKIFTSVGMLGGIRQLVRSWNPKERAAYYTRVCELSQQLAQLKDQLEEVLDAERDGQENVA